MQHTATSCNTLQHTAENGKVDIQEDDNTNNDATWHNTATRLSHTATHYTTLLHSATHCTADIPEDDNTDDDETQQEARVR